MGRVLADTFSPPFFSAFPSFRNTCPHGRQPLFQQAPVPDFRANSGGKFPRRWIWFWVLLCCSLSLLWAAFLDRSPANGMADFKGLYYDARCLIQHSDPYKVGVPLRLYLAEADGHPQPSQTLRQILAQNVYLPTAVVFVTPIAILPWWIAHLLWEFLSACALVLAASLMWSLAARRAPVFSGLLVCFMLANCEALLGTGNSAGIAVSLCVVAVWCFSQQRYVPAGLLCLALSLLLKPHDAGLVWLLFLLAGGVYRKRALQTLALTAALALPCVLWVSCLSPHWMEELHANHEIVSLAGGTSDPGPASALNGAGPSMIIDLQTAFAVFRNDSHFYNPATYLVCGTLLLVGAACILKTRSPASIWLALGAVVPITLLVVYHRPYDAKLLLLTVPACAMLWAEGGVAARIALMLNVAAIVCSADVPLVLLVILNRGLHLASTGIFGQLAAVVRTRPVPLILLIMSIAYLCLLGRRNPAGSVPPPVENA